MKISYEKITLLIFTILLGYSNAAYSQEKKSFFKSSLWLKGNETEIKNEIDTNNSEDKLKKYFNYNPGIDFSKDKILNKYTNLINKKSSLFLVFKSSSYEETNLITIDRGVFKASVDNKKIVCNKEVYLNKGDSKKGILVSYLYNKNSLLEKKDGNLIIDDAFYTSKDFENQLLELIYIPKVVTNKEKNVVESYLSIKYGISLYEDQNYYNSKKDTIWDAKKNVGFNKRVTAIGRDNTIDLNQKQSGNSLKDGLTIGINKIEATNNENKGELADKTFLIWGDNDLKTLMEKENNSIEKRMKRVWKMKTISKESLKNTTTQILIDKKLMAFGEEETLDHTNVTWLAIDSTKSTAFNYSSAKYIKATIDDNEKIIFDGVTFSANTEYLFTLVQAPDFFVTKDIESPNCRLLQNGKLNLGMNGGLAPYKIHLVSNNFDKEIIATTDLMKIENLTMGSYSLEVIDKNKKLQKTIFVIDAINEDQISLSPKWYLSEDKTVQILAKTTELISDYSWLFEGNLVSKEKEFTAKNAGNYTLKVSNQLGCQKELAFEVIDRMASRNYGYDIFPNPIAHNESFTIQFNLKEASKVSVKISDMNGRIIKNKELGTIQRHQFKENLMISGNYLVLVSINGNIEANKLIVK